MICTYLYCLLSLILLGMQLRVLTLGYVEFLNFLFYFIIYFKCFQQKYCTKFHNDYTNL